MDGAVEFLATDLQYYSATLQKWGNIVHLNFHGTCPYELGENVYAKITDPAFIPRSTRYAVAAFASGDGKSGTGILTINNDGIVVILAQQYGLNWIFADVDYML